MWQVWPSGFLKGENCDYVRAFWNAIPEGGVARKLATLVLAGGLARWPRGPSFWRAGWQGGQGE